MKPETNHLINKLPLKVRLCFTAACEVVNLPLSEVLNEPGKDSPYVYFPKEGYISLIAAVDGSPGVEVGMIGREGMLGVQLALGVDATPLRALVQGAGTAWRMGAEAFKAELAASPEISHQLNRYLYVQLAQLAATTACVRFHDISSRWRVGC